MSSRSIQPYCTNGTTLLLNTTTNSKSFTRLGFFGSATVDYDISFGLENGATRLQDITSLVKQNDLPIKAATQPERRQENVHATCTVTTGRYIYSEPLTLSYLALYVDTKKPVQVRIFEPQTRPSLQRYLRRAVVAEGGTHVIDLVGGHGFM